MRAVDQSQVLGIANLINELTVCESRVVLFCVCLLDKAEEEIWSLAAG